MVVNNGVLKLEREHAERQGKADRAAPNLPRPRKRRDGKRREKLAVAVALAASFLLFNLYSPATPLFEASDELWHYPFVQHLAGGGGLPVQRPARQT